MALTRSMLKGMNLTDEQVSAIIDAHSESIEALKQQRDQYKADAEKLPELQRELDSGTDWKNKFDTLRAERDNLEQEFSKYKSDIAGKERLANIKSAYRRLLEAEKIGHEDADLIMAATKFDNMELGEDGALAGADSLTENIRKNYARYIPTIDNKGDVPANPPRADGLTGPNPRAAEIAKAFYERRHGTPDANKQD